MGGDLMAREWDVPGYTEVKTLGSGGFGDVMLARHDASGTQVAIKYLRHQLLADAEFAELFRAEAAVLASLNDPNVVRLYEYIESPQGAAIVMELVDGVPLRDILTRQGKTTAEAAHRPDPGEPEGTLHQRCREWHGPHAVWKRPAVLRRCHQREPALHRFAIAGKRGDPGRAVRGQRAGRDCVIPEGAHPVTGGRRPAGI